jgi:hypothetical protein
LFVSMVWFEWFASSQKWMYQISGKRRSASWWW